MEGEDDWAMAGLKSQVSSFQPTSVNRFVNCERYNLETLDKKIPAKNGLSKGCLFLRRRRHHQPFEKTIFGRNLRWPIDSLISGPYFPLLGRFLKFSFFQNQIYSEFEFLEKSAEVLLPRCVLAKPLFVYFSFRQFFFKTCLPFAYLDLVRWKCLKFTAHTFLWIQYLSNLFHFQIRLSSVLGICLA